MARGLTLRLGLALAAFVLFAVPAQAGAARTLSIADATGTEPAGGGSDPMKFTVTLSAPHKKAVKADYATSPGSADSLDYQPSFGTVKVPAGKTKAKISIPVRGDLFDEPDETFNVELSRAKSAQIDDGEAEGLIPANDDGPDGDGDDIPDADDCAPSDPNPEDQIECFVPATIYELNAGEFPEGTRAYLEDVLITARADNSSRTAYAAIVPGDPGYAGQDFSAIELRSSDFLDISVHALLLGTVRADHFQVSSAPEQDCCGTVPGPVGITPALLAAGPDSFNGLLVEVTGVSIASSDANSWLLEEGVGVDDDLFSDLPEFGPGTAFESIRGHASTLGGGTPSLSPRGLADIDPTVAMLVSINSFDDCLLPDQQDVTIGEVQIDEPQATDTVVALAAEDSSVLTVPSTVTVLAGNTTAPVVADAGPSLDAFTQVTATLDPFEESMGVTVSEFC